MSRPSKFDEKSTRKKLIDKALQEAGWTPIIDFADLTDRARHGTFAVTEYETSEGPADYVLFHTGKAVAAVEAKKLTLGPQNVLSQAQRYARGFRDGEFELEEFHLPFVYSTNGEAIWFQDLREKRVDRGRSQSSIHHKP